MTGDLGQVLVIMEGGYDLLCNVISHDVDSLPGSTYGPSGMTWSGNYGLIRKSNLK